jgi:cytoskeletal protein RodZ
MSREERAQTKLAMTMAEDRHADFGTFLRLAREDRGLSLQELAVTTKISARLLESLERNDPSKLPGGIFSRAFVRAYAREVGLDPDAAVARFVAAFPDAAGADDMPATTSAVEAESFQQGRRVIRAGVRLLGVALLIAFLAFIYVSRFRTNPVGAGPDRAAAPAASPVTEPPPPPQSQPRPEQPASTPMPAADAANVAQPAAGEPSVPIEAIATAPAPETAAASGAQPAGAPSSPAPLVVVLTFNDPCWLSVSVDGTREPSKTAVAGERLEFAVKRSITMTVGNAGVVALTLNGKPGRALGAAGQVVTATITASAYESFLR